MSSNLWPHQSVAVKRILTHLSAHDRVQVHMACGTGKTRVGLEVLSRLRPAFAVWLSPTIDLMMQSAAAAAELLPGRRRQLVGYTRADVPDMSNDVDYLKSQLTQPALLFCTYASFPYLERAFAETARSVDLIVGDEAHRSAGINGRPYGRWLNTDVAVSKRLALTATPRIILDREGRPSDLSMANDASFGTVAFSYPFSQAIQDNIICDVEALVPIIEGEDTPLARAQALVQAQKEYGLERIMSFHGTVKDAKFFASILKELGVDAIHVNGDSSRAEIAAARARLEGSRPVVVTNAKIFGEGIDVPALDAVFFCDFKSSVVDVTQQVGRVVRRREGKNVGYVILPPSSAVELMETFQHGRYKHLWRIVSSILDVSLQHDLRKLSATPLRLTAVGKGARALQPSLDKALGELLYIRRIPISDQSWLMKAADVVRYLEEGHAPYAASSPFRFWLGENSALFQAGKLNALRSQKFVEISALLARRQTSKLETAQHYVKQLEGGASPDHALTVLVRNNRFQPGFSNLYRRMLAVRKNSELQRRARIAAFLDAYEQGVVTDRSIYAQLVAGISDPELNARFKTLHEARLARVEAEKRGRRQEGVRRFRSGEPADRIAADLGVTKSTIWYWERQSRQEKA